MEFELHPVKLQHAGYPSSQEDDYIRLLIGFDPALTSAGRLEEQIRSTGFDVALDRGLGHTFEPPGVSVRAATVSPVHEPGDRGQAEVQIAARGEKEVQTVQIEVRESWRPDASARQFETAAGGSRSSLHAVSIPFEAPPSETADPRLLVTLLYRLEGDPGPISSPARGAFHLPVPVQK